MRQDIIISIRREYSEKIYASEKLFELRKREPSIRIGTKCWIYEPAPVGKITGYFFYGGCIKDSKVKVYWYNKQYLGVSFEEYFKFYEGEYYARAWVIKCPRKLSVPITLGEIGVKRAPQSYIFIDGVIIDNRVD